MQFKKSKILIILIGILTVSVIAAFTLSSCSSSGTANSRNIDVTVGTKKYLVDGSTANISINENDTLTHAAIYNFLQPTSYPFTFETKELDQKNAFEASFISNFAFYIKASLADNMATFGSRGVVNSIPKLKNDFNGYILNSNNSPIAREFAVAFNSGLGSAKNTLRVNFGGLEFDNSIFTEIEAVNFFKKSTIGDDTKGMDINPAEFPKNESSETPKAPIVSVLPKNALKFTVKNVKLNYSYWKTTNGKNQALVSFENLKSTFVSDPQNWTNFKLASGKNIQPTANKFSIELAPISFYAYPTTYMKKINEVEKYFYTGQISSVLIANNDKATSIENSMLLPYFFNSTFNSTETENIQNVKDTAAFIDQLGEINLDALHNHSNHFADYIKANYTNTKKQLQYIWKYLKLNTMVGIKDKI